MDILAEAPIFDEDNLVEKIITVVNNESLIPLLNQTNNKWESWKHVNMTHTRLISKCISSLITSSKNDVHSIHNYTQTIIDYLIHYNENHSGAWQLLYALKEHVTIDQITQLFHSKCIHNSNCLQFLLSIKHAICFQEPSIAVKQLHDNISIENARYTLALLSHFNDNLNEWVQQYFVKYIESAKQIDMFPMDLTQITLSLFVMGELFLLDSSFITRFDNCLSIALLYNRHWPLIVKSHALVMLGKACKESENWTRKCLPLFTIGLSDAEAIIRSNSIVCICDLVKVHTLCVQLHLPLVALRIEQDESEFVRHTARTCLREALATGFVKWTEFYKKVTK
jgi:hypothetical protein